MKTVIRNSYSPVAGDYCEKIVIDKETNKKYLFDCDGVWTLLDGSIDEEEILRKAAEYTDQEVGEEGDARAAADQEIWREIEAIEAASDVVDIVGTHAELENYDTSALKDNDIIKVLQDETHDDAIAYYRWDDSGDEFVFIGIEGPYYTASETDTLLAGKVDKTSVTSTPSFNPMAASETLVMSQKGVAKQVLNENNGGIQISSTAGNASVGSPVAIAVGPGATAGTSPSIAIGYQSKAENVSTALGPGAKAETNSSLALGYYSEAAGSQDIAIGSSASTKVSSGTQTTNNVAIGSVAIAANGGHSFAAGVRDVKATGYGSFAIGSRYVEATGSSSIAIGGYASSSTDKTLASGSISMAIGQYSSAAGASGIAIGQHTVANGISGTAIGHHCTASTTTATGTAAQQNVAIGEHAEATGGYSTAFGNIAVASGKRSFAAGLRVNATADNSMAIGLGNINNEVEASGNSSLAIGTNGAKATGISSTAIGGSANASGVNSVAIGYQDCAASHYNSVALGSFSQTGRSDEVSIGVPASGSFPEKTKYIAHVTAGVNDTDAVNVSQLNAAIPGVMTGATSSAAGTSGLVPAPVAGDDTKFLSGDGTWKTVSGGATYTAGQNIQINNSVISATDTTYSVFTTTTDGLVPACNEQYPSRTYLAGDGSWTPLGIRGSIEFYLPDGGMERWQEGTDDNAIFDLRDIGRPNTYTLSTLTPGSYPNGVITKNGLGRRVYSVDMDALDYYSAVLEFPTDSSRTHYKILSSFPSSLTGHLSFIIQGVENGASVTYLLDIADDSSAADVITKLSPSYTLPPATSSTLGGVIVGSNLSVDANGVLSATIPATNNINTTDWNALWQ